MAKGVSHFRLVLTSGQPGGGGRKRPWGLGLQRKTPFKGMAPSDLPPATPPSAEHIQLLGQLSAVDECHAVSTLVIESLLHSPTN